MRHTAALVVAKVAAIDIPRGEWPDLVSALLASLAAAAGGGAAPDAGVRQATLEALGYVCEELGALEDDYLQQDQVNAILTAVVQGMRKEEPELEVRLVATHALSNALTFAHVNFGSEGERDYIMRIVCEGTMAGARGCAALRWLAGHLPDATMRVRLPVAAPAWLSGAAAAPAHA